MAAPSASNVLIQGSIDNDGTPRTTEDLLLSYAYSDPDSDPEIPPGSPNGTELRWFKGVSSGQRMRVKQLGSTNPIDKQNGTRILGGAVPANKTIRYMVDVKVDSSGGDGEHRINIMNADGANLNAALILISIVGGIGSIQVFPGGTPFVMPVDTIASLVLDFDWATNTIPSFTADVGGGPVAIVPGVPTIFPIGAVGVHAIIGFASEGPSPYLGETLWDNLQVDNLTDVTTLVPLDNFSSYALGDITLDANWIIFGPPGLQSPQVEDDLNFTQQVAYDDLSTVPNAATAPGEQWFATVRPSDGT